MNIKDRFLQQAEDFKEKSDSLYNLVDELGERIIIHDMSGVFRTTFKKGYNTIINCSSLEEVRIDGCVFNMIQRDKDKYKAYQLHFEKKYNFPYLGFRFKGDIVSPHIDGKPLEIIEKYNDEEISEILFEVKKRISAIDNDINYINSELDLQKHKFFYRNYDGMFDGHEKFNDLKEVFENFKSL